MVHGIWPALDVHFQGVLLYVNVVNTFNTIFHKVLF
jgi:hypothetical protein